MNYIMFGIFLLSVSINNCATESTSHEFIEVKKKPAKKQSRNRLKQLVAENFETLMHQSASEIEQLTKLDQKNKKIVSAIVNKRYCDLQMLLNLLKTGKTSELNVTVEKKINIHDVITEITHIQHEIMWRLRELVDEDIKGIVVKLSTAEMTDFQGQLERIIKQNQKWFHELSTSAKDT